MNSKFCRNGSVLGLMLLILVLVPVRVLGQVQSVISQSWSLSKFMVADDQIIIRNASGSYDLSFPISDRIIPDSAVLNLFFTNSNILINNRSQLIVYINDFILGQIKLDPVNNTTEAKFKIDKAYLRQGYNKISFKAAQHYTDSQCEDWSAPELWTHLDATKSTLDLTYHQVPIIEKLSIINSLINDRLGEYSFSIIRGDQTVSDDYLNWGGLIAQGVKLRLKYVPMKIHEQYAIPNTTSIEGGGVGRFNIGNTELGHDAFLVGNKEQLSQLIPQDVLQAIQGPYLGLFRQDADPAHFFLVVSGRNNDEVKMAAKSFALLDAPFPAAQQTVISDLMLPDANSVLAKQSILSARSYRFSALDYSNSVMHAEQTAAKLQFRLPADFYSTEDAMVSLNLDLAYGAGMRKDSVININLNDSFVHAIQLKEAGGAHYRNYQIEIPLRNFKAGINKLTFNALMKPSEYGECIYVQRDNLVVNIFEDSIISFPKAASIVSLPDLEILERTGFPFLNDALADNTVFKLLDTSSDSMTAAWQLIAHMASYYQAPVLDLNITQDKEGDKKYIVLVGKVSANNVPAILVQAPVTLGVQNRFPYRYKEKQSEPSKSVLDWLDQMLFDEESALNPVSIEPENASLVQSSGLGDQYLLMSYIHEPSDRIVLALVSEGQNDLYPGVMKLFASGLWSQIQGNVFVWNQEGQFYWDRQGNTVVVGEGDQRMSWVMHFSKHPWQWLIIVVGFLLIMAWVVHKLLSRYQKATHT